MYLDRRPADSRRKRLVELEDRTEDRKRGEGGQVRHTKEGAEEGG